MTNNMLLFNFVKKIAGVLRTLKRWGVGFMYMDRLQIPEGSSGSPREREAIVWGEN